MLRTSLARLGELKVSSFTPHELTRLVLRAVREKRSEPQLWKAVALRANALIGQMSPYDMSVVVFGLGLMGYRDRGLLEKTAGAVIPALPAMSMNDISHLLAGFARVDVRNDLLFYLASREIGKKIPSTKSLSEISNMLHAFTCLNYEHPLLFEAMAKRTVFLLPFAQSNGATAGDIAKLVESFSTISPTPNTDKLFAILSSEICRRIEEFPVSAVARIANSYAKKNVLNSNQFLTELVLDESFRRRNEFDPKSISLLLNAVAKTKNTSSPKLTLLFDYFSADLCKRGLGKLDLQGLTLLANAFSKINCVETVKLFQLIGDRVAAVSDQLSGRQVATLAKAFAAVGCRHGPLLFNLPSHFEQFIQGISLPEIAAVMHAYAKLGIRNDTILDCAPERVKILLTAGSEKRKEISTGDREIFALTTGGVGNVNIEVKIDVHAAVDILESYAMLMVNQKEIIPQLVAKISENCELLKDKQLVEIIPKSVNILMIKCPEKLVRRIAEAAEKNWENLTEGEINEIQMIKNSQIHNSFITS
jgi:hypothetical protein